MNQLQQNLDALQTRRVALGAQLETAGAEQERAKQGLVVGTPGALEALAAAQNQATALRSAVLELDQQIAVAQSELQAATAKAARDAKISALLETATTASAMLDDLETTRQQAAAALETSTAQVLTLIGELATLRTSFLQTIGSQDDLMADVSAQADVSAVRHPWPRSTPGFYGSSSGGGFDLHLPVVKPEGAAGYVAAALAEKLTGRGTHRDVARELAAVVITRQPQASVQ
jgi:multidrug efflux pump subunit AcrA (membrane-fusion protein)